MPNLWQTYGGALYRKYCQLEEKVVAPASEDPLLLISATKAAELIRNGEVIINYDNFNLIIEI